MSLRIESRHSASNGRPLNTYKLAEDQAREGSFRLPLTVHGTVGAEIGEPYAVVFTNPTAGPVEVRISIDGIDILTGLPASLATTGPRHFVGPKATIVIEAWPESNQGGGRFVFAPEGMAVADFKPTGSPKGVIAAAMFIESAPPPRPMPSIVRGMSSGRLGEESAQSYSYSPMRSAGSPAKGVGTGVGEYVAQPMTEVAGLRQPTLAGIYQVGVMLWEDLLARIEPGGAPAPTNLAAVGFPAEKGFRGPSLTGIPRMPSLRQPTRLG